MSKIAIAAESQYTPDSELGAWYDDQKLKESLEERGHAVTIISWEDKAINLLQFDSIFVSSTWNACDHPQEFIEWLDKSESDGKKRLINSREVIDDGFTKYKYLSILSDSLSKSVGSEISGYITPSKFYVCGDALHKNVKSLGKQTLADILFELDEDPLWINSNIVIKPIVSGDGKGTFVYNRSETSIPCDEEKREEFVITNLEKAQAKFYEVANDTHRGGAIIQPYIQGVEKGEYSLTFFNRECSHAIQKPRLFKGDGSVRRQVIDLKNLPPKMLEFSRFLIESMKEHYGEDALTRARVDLFDQDGTPVLCELECVDPNTNIKTVANQLGSSFAKTIFEDYANVIESRTEALLAQSIS